MKRYSSGEDDPLAEVAKALLLAGASLQEKSPFENSPLRFAIDKQYSTTIDQLLNEKINRGLGGMAPYYSNEDYVKNVLATIETLTNYLQPVFPYVGFARGVELVRRLGLHLRDRVVSRQIYLDVEDSDGNTVLINAAKKRMSLVVAILILAGANINHINDDHDTMMRVFMKNLHARTVKELETILFIVGNPSLYGRTLRVASEFNRTDIVSALLAHYSTFFDINSSDALGNTALMKAAQKGHRGVFELLLSHKDILVNAQNLEGNSALHLAAQEGHAGAVRLLMLKDGINVGLENSQKKNAKLLAVHQGQQHIVDLLEKPGTFNSEETEAPKSQALRFTVKCQRNYNSPYGTGYYILCMLKNVDLNEDTSLAGFVSAGEIDRNKILVEYLEICPSYQERGLSSVLLYHIMSLIKENITSKTVLLNDESSISDSTGLQHYTRYGFTKVADVEFKIAIDDFLQDPKNLTRYRFRYGGGNIAFDSQLESVKEMPLVKCP